jgi:hypothetical protein
MLAAMNLQTILTISFAAVGALVALVTAIKAYAEYLQQGTQRRAQMFFDLRHRLQEPHFIEISELVDHAVYGNPADASEAQQRLASLPLGVKREYLGLFEEIALAMSWGLVEPKVANYMFGYYARNCRECPAFWFNVNPGSIYWAVFYEFCRQMDDEHDALERRLDSGEGWRLSHRQRHLRVGSTRHTSVSSL